MEPGLVPSLNESQCVGLLCQNSGLDLDGSLCPSGVKGVGLLPAGDRVALVPFQRILLVVTTGGEQGRSFINGPPKGRV